MEGKSEELQNIAIVLTQTMSRISVASQTSVRRLRDLCGQLERATRLEDIRGLKTQLAECLESIRSKSESQREESARALAELRNGLNKAQEPIRVESSAESAPLGAVGLRGEAEMAVEAASHAGSHTYAALCVVDRIEATTARFGQAVAEQVMTFFLQHLSKDLSPDDKRYRWGPKSFLILANRRKSADQMRKEMAGILAQRLDQTFEIGSRTVSLPITSTWFIIPLFESTCAQVLQKLDAFGGCVPRK
jgi:GGDEF domain-containing protein